MVEDVYIRDSDERDAGAIQTLYKSAFPEEDLIPLVKKLLEQEDVILSLVADIDGEVVGHAIFTTCGIDGMEAKISLLGPLGVAPKWHRQGIGSSLVRAGIARLEGMGIRRLLVLGDPNYYARFGFLPDADIAPPYPLPEAWHGAWRFLSIGGDTPGLAGTMTVPSPWQNPAYWRE